MGALIAPARAGFAPPDRSPLLMYTRSQHLLCPRTVHLSWPWSSSGPCATSLADTSGLPYRAPSPGSQEGLAQLPSLCSCRRAGGLFPGLLQCISASSPALSPLIPQPGLRMAELSPVLESGFTATETAFPPLQSAIKPRAGCSVPSLALSVQDPGVVLRCPSAASLHFIQLQAPWTSQPSHGTTRPSWGK